MIGVLAHKLVQAASALHNTRIVNDRDMKYLCDMLSKVVGCTISSIRQDTHHQTMQCA
jgi:hypothetical protein